MSDEISNVLKMISILEVTIKYLEENKIKIVDEATKNILLNNHIYEEELKNNDNLDKFKKSIINHIQWVLDDLYNPNINFNDYKFQEINISKAYIDIYKEINKIILNSDTDQEVKEILQDYFYALSKIF